MGRVLSPLLGGVAGSRSVGLSMAFRERSFVAGGETLERNFLSKDSFGRTSDAPEQLSARHRRRLPGRCTAGHGTSPIRWILLFAEDKRHSPFCVSLECSAPRERDPSAVRFPRRPSTRNRG